MRQSVIHLHPQAPPKPATGQACNGCGLCCAWAARLARRWIAAARGCDATIEPV